MIVKSEGKVRIKIGDNEIEVNNVMYIPKISVNLLSISKMVEQGNSVLFDNYGCTIKNRKGDTIAHCKATDGVYKLCMKSETCLITAKSTEQPTWVI